jgi:hypothetical protein
MKVTNLEIAIAASYESNAGQYVGLVELTGFHGKQIVTLSPGSIAKVFEVIREQVAVTAKAAAREVPAAMQDAADSVGLLTATITEE